MVIREGFVRLVAAGVCIARAGAGALAIHDACEAIVDEVILEGLVKLVAAIVLPMPTLW